MALGTFPLKSLGFNSPSYTCSYLLTYPPLVPFGRFQNTFAGENSVDCLH